MIDASVLVAAYGTKESLGDAAWETVDEHEYLAAPDIIDAETTSGLRGRWLGGLLTTDAFEGALNELGELNCARFPVHVLLPRIFELRDNLPVYDAAYVALAEALGWPLVTGDRRIRGAPGIRCEVQVLSA